MLWVQCLWGLEKPICVCLVESCLMQPKGQIFASYSPKTVLKIWFWQTVDCFSLHTGSSSGLQWINLQLKLLLPAATSSFSLHERIQDDLRWLRWSILGYLWHHSNPAGALSTLMNKSPYHAFTASEADPLNTACSRIPRAPKTSCVIPSADVKYKNQTHSEMQELHGLDMAVC